MNKRSILRKTFHFGTFTFLSRILAFPREILQIKFLGVGILSDAFIAAFRLPNFFRRIFAEGAVSAAFIPSYVQLEKNNKHETANGVMTLSFLFFEGIVVLLSLLVFLFPRAVLLTVTPGFSPEQIETAIPLLRILFPFLLFVSSSALLSGALQAKNHFFAQSFGPVVHNIIYVLSLVYCLYYHKDPYLLAMGIVLSGAAMLLLHVVIYLRFKFRFGAITADSKREFKKILIKFLPCLVGVGVVEINLYLDNVISSFLANGSYTLLYSAFRFMSLPLGVFAVAFSTILLPHFSRLRSYAPKRLHFYLLETAKFTTWTIVPATLFIFYSSSTIFSHILPDKSRVAEASAILICYSVGLIFHCFNKVLINIFYSLDDTWNPTYASILSTVVNLIFNIIGMYFLGSPGIALSTSISGVFLTFYGLHLLRKKHRFRLYWESYFSFLGRYLIQLCIGIALFLGLHKLVCFGLKGTTMYTFFCIGWGYWIFTIPLFLFTMMILFLIKRMGNVNVYFLNK